MRVELMKRDSVNNIYLEHLKDFPGEKILPREPYDFPGEKHKVSRSPQDSPGEKHLPRTP